jgi:hypothetical protein
MPHAIHVDYELVAAGKQLFTVVPELPVIYSLHAA